MPLTITADLITSPSGAVTAMMLADREASGP